MRALQGHTGGIIVPEVMYPRANVDCNRSANICGPLLESVRKLCKAILEQASNPNGCPESDSVSQVGANAVAYHVTKDRAVPSIQHNGLLRRSRDLVHLNWSPSKALARMKKGKGSVAPP